MNSRFVPVGVFLLASLASMGTAAPASGQAPARPNIVWISSEDMSPHLGSYGDRVARTPNLDRLAREGVRFTNAFVTNPICAPSRSAIITGMYQTAIGTLHMRVTEDRVPELPGPYLAVPPHYVKAFPEYLRAAGYYTSNNVKTDYQIGNPTTIWDENSRTAHWRNRPDKSQPFFSVFNFTVTHESQVWAHNPENRGKALVTNPASVAVPPYYPDTRPVRDDLARLYDNIAEMDGMAGAILRQLEEDGLAQNTIVFFWGDHGDGLPRAKRSLYDSGLRVPLIVRWPGHLRPGSVNEELVSFIDLAPTVLTMAGVDVPAHMQGRSLVGPNAGKAPQYIFAARDREDISYDMMRAVMDGRYKYIRNFHPELPYVLLVPYRNQNATMQELLRLHEAGKLTGAQKHWMASRRPPEELYDTRADPHEVRNLAADPAHRATLERMRVALVDWMERTRDWGLVPEAEMIQRMWPGGVQPETGKPRIMPRNVPDFADSTSFTLPGPAEVVIYVPTQGASVEYTTGSGDGARWRLYAGPIRVSSDVTIRARAVRYGYRESPEAQASFRVRAR